MAYQQYNLTHIEDVPGKIVDFVTNNMTGWSAATGSAGPNGETTCTVTIPGAPSRTLKVLAKDGTGTIGDRVPDNYVFIKDDSGTPSNEARLFSPVYATGSGLSDVSPRTADKLWLFGHPPPTGAEETGLAGVISFGTGRYRHFYMGKLAKHGTWTDGSVWAAGMSAYYRSFYTRGAIAWDDSYHHYLFNGLNNFASSDFGYGKSGAVCISSTEDPNTVREFVTESWGYSTSPNYYGTGDEVFGGPLDGPAGTLLSAGFAPATDANIVIPIELYGLYDSGNSGDDKWFYRPLGRVVGAYMCNMKNLSPEQSISVGSKTFMAFPASRYDPTTDYNLFTSGNQWPDEDNSGPVGYAYAV